MDDVMSGNDIYLSQGWPIQLMTSTFEGMTDRCKKDLAACGYSLPAMTTCMAAYYLNPYAPWWGEKRDD